MKSLYKYIFVLLAIFSIGLLTVDAKSTKTTKTETTETEKEEVKETTETKEKEKGSEAHVAYYLKKSVEIPKREFFYLTDEELNQITKEVADEIL